MDEVKTNIGPSDSKPEEKKDDRTPEQKVQDTIKPYDFIKFTAGHFIVNHDECKEVLEPKILAMGDLSERGRILSRLNGGASNIDAETLSLNTFLATIQVGFSNLKIDLFKLKDADLVDALYLAVKSYQAFFRTQPLGILL